MITFKANLINYQSVQRIDCNNKVIPGKAAFVELLPVSIYDQSMLDLVTPLWGGKEDSFAYEIS